MDSRIFLMLLAPLICGCSVHSHMRAITSDHPGISLSVVKDDTVRAATSMHMVDDTVQVVDIGGRRMMLVRAEKDTDGELVASDVLNEATVVARFRNVAERNGAVELRFRISVPEKLLDSRWQARFYPTVNSSGLSFALDSICITGKEYRKTQLKGYQRYEKLLASLSADSTRFVDTGKLEIFLERNIPQIYSLKNDTTDVPDRLSSIFDVDRQEAVSHYTNRFLVRSNARKVASKDRLFAKWVKSPITEEGIRLDTVINGPTGDFIYEYVEVMRAVTSLKKVSVSVAGAVFEKDRRTLSIPVCDSITYYISSLSSFAEDVPDADSSYRKGIRAIRDRDYKTAVTLLRPYRDFNSALAYCAMGYDASALDVLYGLEQCPKVLYLEAVLLARKGNREDALGKYIDACAGDPSLVHRGNLDPEIAALKNGMDIIEDE